MAQSFFRFKSKNKSLSSLSFFLLKNIRSIQYGTTYSNYIHWCVTCSNALSWTYDSMSFTTCVDKCTASTTTGPYYDGASYTLVGTSSKADEWLTIAATTEVRSDYIFILAQNSYTRDWIICLFQR